MARNQEKAQSMLYRFREAQMEELGLRQHYERRPPHTKMATTIPEADRWRSQVVKDITRKVSRIHDPGLSDPQIRELNDDINNLLKEKWRWERRVQELGGPDWTRLAARSDPQGREMFGVKGYKYFGRAKELPEVKDYFDKIVSPASNDKATNLMAERAQLDAQYYGFIPPQELLAFEQTQHNEQLEALHAQLGPIPDTLYMDDPVGQLLASSASLLRLPFLPSVKEVEQHLVQQRKLQILARLPN